MTPVSGAVSSRAAGVWTGSMLASAAFVAAMTAAGCAAITDTMRCTAVSS
jgi:hypothetical protein